MKRILIRMALAGAVVSTLAACSNKNDNFSPTDTSSVPPPATVPPPPPAFSVESFGARFAAIFRTAADTEPSDPGEGDIIPIDFTTEAGEPIGF